MIGKGWLIGVAGEGGSKLNSKFEMLYSLNPLGLFGSGGAKGDSTVVVEPGEHCAEPSLFKDADWFVDAENDLL